MKLQTITDARGSLTVAEKLSFPIKRVYWLHGIDRDAMRGGHAQKTTKRIIVAVSGSFRVLAKTWSWTDKVLKRPDEGFVVEPMTWLELSEFSPDAVCLVLASEEHDEADSVRDFGEFIRLRRSA